MALTFGVLGTIIKACSFHATNQTVVSRLVSTIDPNEKYLDKKNAPAACRLLNCTYDFPDPAVDSESATDLFSLLPNYRDTAKILPNFTEKVLPLMQPDKVRYAIAALQDAVRDDSLAYVRFAEIFQETVGMTASEFVSCQSFDLAKTLAGLFLYTLLIENNKSGRETHARISLPSYWDELQPGFMAIDTKWSRVDDIFALHGLSDYRQRAMARYKSVPTFLLGRSDFNFDDIFVCSNIKPEVSGREIVRIVEDATIDRLRQFSPRIILHALGGNGKSMMLLHLFFDALERMESTGMIPMYICLRYYTPGCKSLLGFLAGQVRELWPQFDFRLCASVIMSGKAVLLLDGLDEMTDEAYDRFKNDLSEFTRKCPDTQIILSARPYAEWLNEITGFRKAQLQELTREQALTFIDKLNLYPNDPARHNKFRFLVEHELYPNQREFASNPLLLTAMMMVYHEDGEIPTRSFEFFERVYDILSNSHDNTKGGFKRVFATGLDRQTLKQYLAEFAYRAYVAKAWSLSMERCNEIYGSLHSREQEATPTLCADFMTDVTKNLSIMYGEANTFNFYQHTFQEFFTALYFANRPGSQMKNLIRFFESSRPRTLNDYVFPMLYDMRKSQVDESIILPTLRKAFKKRPEAETYVQSLSDATRKEAGALAGYWSYLLNQYPIIEYRKGSSEDGDFVISPLSVIIEYVLQNTKDGPDERHGDPIFHSDLNANEIPGEGFVEERFYRINGKILGDQQDHRTLIALQDSGHDAEEVYRNIRIDIRVLLDCAPAERSLVEYMENDEFPLKKEYLALKRHYNSLTRDRSSNSRELRRAV